MMFDHRIKLLMEIMYEQGRAKCSEPLILKELQGIERFFEQAWHEGASDILEQDQSEQAKDNPTARLQFLHAGILGQREIAQAYDGRDGHARFFDQGSGKFIPKRISRVVERLGNILRSDSGGNEMEERNNE